MSLTLRRLSGFFFIVFFLTAFQSVFAVKPSSSKNEASGPGAPARKTVKKKYTRTILSTGQTETWTVTLPERLTQPGGSIDVITRIEQTTGDSEVRRYTIMIPSPDLRSSHWDSNGYFISGGVVTFSVPDNSARARNRSWNLSNHFFNLYTRLDSQVVAQTVPQSNTQACAAPSDTRLESENGFWSGIIYGMPMLEPQQLPHFTGSRITAVGDGTVQYKGTDLNGQEILLTVSNTGPNGSLELIEIQTPDIKFELIPNTEDSFEIVNLEEQREEEGNRPLPGNNETDSEESSCGCCCFKFGFRSNSRM